MISFPFFRQDENPAWQPIGHCGCGPREVHHCICDCERPEEAIVGECACGGPEVGTFDFSPEARKLLPKVWSTEPMSRAERRLAISELRRLDREVVPKPLEAGFSAPFEAICANKNWVRSLLTKGWKEHQNDQTEVIRALMSAFDCIGDWDEEAAKFWIQLAAKLLTDSVSKINQRIKDGLLEAVNAPELSSKRRRRSTFLSPEDLVNIDRAREVSSAILAPVYRPEARRFGGGQGKGNRDGKGKGFGGKGKGRW